MTRTTLDETPVQATKWRPFNLKPKPSLYLDASAGIGMTNNGEPFRCEPKLSAVDLIEALPQDIQTVYLCGDLPKAPQVKTKDELLYSPFNSWIIEAHPGSMYLDSGADPKDTMAVIRAQGGSNVDLRVVASWTGTNDLTPESVYEAMALVTRGLQRQPHWENASTLKTPSITGRELWRSSIGFTKGASGQHTGIEYPILPQDLRELIHASSGQGRFEMLPCPDASGMAPALYYLDDILAYGAQALHDLGIGPATHDYDDAYAGWTPARYRVRFHIPDDWHHVGLLPVQRALRKGAAVQGLEFPLSPGYVGETWVDSRELRVAYAPFPTLCPTCLELSSKNDGRSCPEHGWDIQIQERILFTNGRPLRSWAEKLIQVRESVSPNLVAQAVVRNMILHTIGAFHGTHRPTTHTTESIREAPGNTPLQVVLNSEGEESYIWAEGGFAPRYLDYERPEWSSQVWARERARLLLHRYSNGVFTGALTLPFGSIVAFRLDALYTTINPGWPDNSRPGQLRLKGHLSGPTRWPKEPTDLAAVKEVEQ